MTRAEAKVLVAARRWKRGVDRSVAGLMTAPYASSEALWLAVRVLERERAAKPKAGRKRA